MCPVLAMCPILRYLLAQLQMRLLLPGCCGDVLGLAMRASLHYHETQVFITIRIVRPVTQ